MKKIIVTFLGIMMAISLSVGLAVMGVSAEEESYKILEDFESYTSTEDIKNIYQNYQYAGEKSVIELNTTASDCKGGTGQSLKITSSMESIQKENAAVSVSALEYEAGYKGFSFWIKNPGETSIGIYPQFAYGPMPKASSPYQIMADGETEFTDAETTEEQYYNIQIPAGFSGMIRIPFNSFNSPVTSFNPVLFIAWGGEDPFTEPYTFFLDEIGLYGIAEEAPVEAVAPNDDYEMLDNFDAYDAQTAPSEKGYSAYEYGNQDTTLVFIDYKEGKALEVGNAARNERADFLKSFELNAEAKGLSFFVENKSGTALSFNPQINYAQSPVVGRDYFIRAEGEEEYTKITASGSVYYPLTIDADFKGEIALPFTVYGDVTTLENMVFQIYGPTTDYTVVFDDFRLYGIVGGMSVTLDSFDSYADNQAVTTGGYGLYAYGSTDSAFELIDDGKGGKALKLMNFKDAPSGGQDNQRIDIQKTYNYLDGAKGISIYVKNTGSESLSMGFVINYGYFNQALTGTHYVKADGKESFTEGVVTTNPYYAIEIPGGFSGTVRLPIELFSAVYDPLICVFQFYAESAEYYEVIIDDVELYGLPEQAIEPEDIVSAIEVTSKMYGFIPQVEGEVFTMQISCRGLNVNNEVCDNHSYEFSLVNAVNGVTLTKSGLLTVTGEASLGEIEILAKVVYDADGSYGKEQTFSINLSLGESALESIGTKKAPPAASEKDYFLFN